LLDNGAEQFAKLDAISKEVTKINADNTMTPVIPVFYPVSVNFSIHDKITYEEPIYGSDKKLTSSWTEG